MKNKHPTREYFQEDLIMTASSLSFKLAVLFVITGIAMGIGMAASQNHSIMPAHAHLNLLGWVSLFLFGIYYERRPALDTSRLALIQVALWSIGTVVLTIAVAAIHLGYTAADPIAALASLVVLAGMLLFAYFVFRPSRYMVPAPTARLTPAE
jgi:magnesium-transporting ATPase (P-type)